LFEFDMMATGPGVIGIHHRDYVDLELRTRIDAKTGEPVEFVLDRGWSIEVVVRSQLRGDPIAGARVDAGISGGRTNSEGVLIVDHLAAPSVDVVVTAKGWVTAVRTVERSDAQRPSVRFELEEAGALEGSVADERGEPVAGAGIRILDPSTREELAEANTRAKGKFHIEGVRAGPVLVEVSPPNALSAVLAPIEVESDVQRGTLTRDLLLRFDRL
jgi:hypothetical protein